MFKTFSQFATLSLLLATVVATAPKLQSEDAMPMKGAMAADFTLPDLDGKEHSLSDALKNGPVVVVVLRGFPGYQCPLCTKQVTEFTKVADEFESKKATVMMVYPGSDADLTEKAKEFLAGAVLPEGFVFVTDNDYKFTNAWNLRWDAKNETAYPSTFVIGKDGTVQMAKISKSHGDRASSKEVLAAVEKMK